MVAGRRASQPCRGDRLSTAAIALVLAAAVVHASWNLLAKQLGGGASTVLAYTLAGLAVYAPIGLVALVIDSRPDLHGLAWIAVGGVLQTVYFLALQRAYATGDLSIVYPLARGIGPVLAVAGGIVLFGERPGPVALVGAVFVAVGILALLGAGLRHGRHDAAAIRYALLTAATIGTYTLWDGHGVRTLGLSPWVYLWLAEIVVAVLVGAYLRTRLDEVRAIFARSGRRVAAVGFLQMAGYSLVLAALQRADVSRVAPARELSIALGAAAGARLLGEPLGRRRVAAATVVACGVAALAVG